MKKLNLQLGSIKEMLTKEEMKKISGGGYNSHPGGNPIIQCFPIWGNPLYPDANPGYNKCTYSNTDLSLCQSYCYLDWGSPCDCMQAACHGNQQHGGAAPCA